MKTVLVVEDSEDNIVLVERALGRLYHVIVARDGRAGLEAVRTHLPSLVLMDVSLPELDGIEATRQLKADPATAAVPVFIVSAHAIAETVDRARAAGCDGYITKPVAIRELRERVAQAVGAGP